MSIEKEFVPYEVASEMKELGFDEPCFTLYTPSKIFVDGNDGELVKNSDLIVGACATPTFSQCFRWFREVHGFGIYIETWMNGGVKKFRYKNDYPPVFFGLVYDSYEEAEIALLNKLIEILKTKQP